MGWGTKERANGYAGGRRPISPEDVINKKDTKRNKSPIQTMANSFFLVAGKGSGRPW